MRASIPIRAGFPQALMILPSLRVAAATCRLDHEHHSIFRAVAKLSRESWCGKSTSGCAIINLALNIALEERRSACLYQRHEHDPYRSPSRQAVRCDGDRSDP